MKKWILLLVPFALGTGSLLATATVSAETPIYRLYNPQNNEHLYTNEKEVLYNQHGWGYEGIGWYAPDGGTPVYRLYNSGLQNHLYTSDLNEIGILTSRYGWVKDNDGRPVFYSGGATAIYRVYNSALRGLHHWTTDANEYNTLPAHGWQQEGIKFTAERLGAPVTTVYANPTPAPTPAPAPGEPYYANCTDVKNAGKAPLYRGQPGFRDGLDRNKNGIACELE